MVACEGLEGAGKVANKVNRGARRSNQGGGSVSRHSELAAAATIAWRAPQLEGAVLRCYPYLREDAFSLVYRMVGAQRGTTGVILKLRGPLPLAGNSRACRQDSLRHTCELASQLPLPVSSVVPPL